MADIDSLSSDSDDEEYIPEGAVPSSGGSDASEGEPEDDAVGLGKRRSLRQAQGAAASQGIRRKRQRRSLHSNYDKSGPVSETGQTGQTSEVVQEEEEKKSSRIDDLWASFKMETAQPKKTRQPSASGEVAAIASKTQSTQGKAVDSPSVHSERTTSSEKLIKVKEKYDFAGEEIVVEKEVAKDSKEAQKYLQTQQQLPAERQQPISLTSSAPQKIQSSTPSMEAKRMSAGTKRLSGLSAVLQSIEKKPKMSTLDKSHLDWKKFKEKEGLEDELTQHNKDGYLAKRDFLHKADLKQFELEREERLKRFRRMY